MRGAKLYTYGSCWKSTCIQVASVAGVGHKVTMGLDQQSGRRTHDVRESKDKLEPETISWDLPEQTGTHICLSSSSVAAKR